MWVYVNSVEGNSRPFRQLVELESGTRIRVINDSEGGPVRIVALYADQSCITLGTFTGTLEANNKLEWLASLLQARDMQRPKLEVVPPPRIP